MPLHFTDRDIVPELHGVDSALIVPCNMCPAATVAARTRKPFLQLFRSFFTSPPFERYIEKLQSRLAAHGVRTEVFKIRLYHHWFMCMWTARRRKRLRQVANRYDAVIVLGCESATATAREAVEAAGCKIIEGMKVSGIMNAQLRFRLPANVFFERCKIVPISKRTTNVEHAR